MRSQLKNKGAVFIESLKFIAVGGQGGKGLEKYGGIGGNGGNVYLQGSKGMSLRKLSRILNLNDVNRKKKLKTPISLPPIIEAEAGMSSTGNNLLGSNGKSIVVQVPSGTTVYGSNGIVLGSIDKPQENLLIAEGGLGGRGKSYWKGEQPKPINLSISIKMLADIGLIGFPNAGKSSILKSISAATPKIASYPFTTLRPQIGMLVFPDTSAIAVADLPGLVDYAADNFGMGHSFLKHCERTKALAIVVDVNGFQLSMKYPQFYSPEQSVLVLNKQLEAHDPALCKKPAILVLNKIDKLANHDQLVTIKNKISDLYNKNEPENPKISLNICKVLFTSTVTGAGIKELMQELKNLVPPTFY